MHYPIFSIIISPTTMYYYTVLTDILYVSGLPAVALKTYKIIHKIHHTFRFYLFLNRVILAYEMAAIWFNQKWGRKIVVIFSDNKVYDYVTLYHQIRNLLLLHSFSGVYCWNKNGMVKHALVVPHIGMLTKNHANMYRSIIFCDQMKCAIFANVHFMCIVHCHL